MGLISYQLPKEIKKVLSNRDKFFTATGGVISRNGEYTIHTFIGDGTFTVSGGTPMPIEYLIVAGGGGGGSDMGGGGGAGGVLIGSTSLSTGTFNIVIGSGGAGAPAGTSGPRGTNGNNTTGLGLIAIGGGGGASDHDSDSYPAGNGGSGGGGSGGRLSSGSYGGLPGTGTPGQGFDGSPSGVTWYPGGGGGAGGGGGTNPATGGDGIASAILGTSYFWGGGGGGSGHSSIGGNGGKGGGGGGAVGTTVGGSGFNSGVPGGGGGTSSQTNTPGGNAGANTGGGGGGGSHYNSNNFGGNGGSGIVIIRYKTPNILGNTINPYVSLSYAVNSNLTVTNFNHERSTNIFKTSGGGSWDNNAYSLTGFTAPCTLEFNKQAAAGDNGVSYAAIGWNEDPWVGVGINNLDYASYPYTKNSYRVLNNGNEVSVGGSWSSEKKFYIVYDPDGFMRHYNGETLLYSVNYGYNKIVYVDSSFNSPNTTFGGFSNIKASQRYWNGTKYIDLPYGISTLSMPPTGNHSRNSTARSDPNASYLILNIPFWGPNNNTSTSEGIADIHATVKGSGTNLTLTNNSSLGISTSQYKYYGASASFNYSNLDTPALSGLDGAMTFECWWRHGGGTSGFGDQSGTIWNSNPGGGYSGPGMGYSKGGTFYMSGCDIDSTVFNPSVGTWYHLAFARTGTGSGHTSRFFVNAVLYRYGTNDTTNHSTVWRFGISNGGYTYGSIGYMQDVRVYSGLCKYTSDFG